MWRGGRGSKGYGIIKARALFGPMPIVVHRAAWLILRGPIPEDLTIHHTCREKLCWNPRHLTLIARDEHTRLHNAEAREALTPR